MLIFNNVNLIWNQTFTLLSHFLDTLHFFLLKPGSTNQINIRYKKIALKVKTKFYIN